MLNNILPMGGYDHMTPMGMTMGLVNYKSHHVAKNSPGGAGGRCSAKDHRIKLAQNGTLWYPRRYKSMPRSSKIGPKIIR